MIVWHRHGATSLEILVADDTSLTQDTTMTVVGFLLPVTFAACSEFVVEGMKFGELQRWAITLIVVDLIGATSYIFRWPERWFPGRFDFIGKWSSDNARHAVY